MKLGETCYDQFHSLTLKIAQPLFIIASVTCTSIFHGVQYNMHIWYLINQENWTFHPLLDCEVVAMPLIFLVQIYDMKFIVKFRVK